MGKMTVNKAGGSAGNAPQVTNNVLFAALIISPQRTIATGSVKRLWDETSKLRKPKAEEERKCCKGYFVVNQY